MSSQRLKHLISVSVKICAFLPGLVKPTTMTNHGSLQNPDSSIRSKKMLTGRGTHFFYKQAKYTLEKKIRVAKRNYSDKLRIQFSSSGSASMWKGMKDITSYKTQYPSTVENQQHADNLNEFYCRFEKHPTPALNTSPHNH